MGIKQSLQASKVNVKQNENKMVKKIQNQGILDFDPLR